MLRRFCQWLCPHWLIPYDGRFDGRKVWWTECRVCHKRSYLLGRDWVTEQDMITWFERHPGSTHRAINRQLEREVLSDIARSNYKGTH